ncbi:hypothetical protein PCANB_002506 [Pneumocystis canis]|nr:hypothetical protein PCANB_002506 [Pneumocystis canis]
MNPNDEKCVEKSSMNYKNWTPEIKNNIEYMSDRNFHTPPDSFSILEIQKDIVQESPIGFWRHPSLDIIFQRIRKAGVDEETIKRLIVNILTIIIIQWVKNYIKKKLSGIYLKQFINFKIYLKYFNIFIHIILLYNIFEATLRFIRPKDTFLDLSLTPIQRKLFGLDPHVFNSSPNNNITPPKYTKSSPQNRQLPRLSPQQITPYNEGSQTSHANSETKNPSKPSPLRNELSSPSFMNLNPSPTNFSNKDTWNRASFTSGTRYLYKRYSLDSSFPQ